MADDRPARAGLADVVGPCAALVVLACAVLAACCLVTVPDLVVEWGRLEAFEPHLAGAGAFAALLAGLSFGGAIWIARSAGVGGGLVAGAGLSVLSLLLSRHPASDVRLVLGLFVSAAAVGLLASVGVSLGVALERQRRTWPIAAWALSLGTGLPVVAWVANRTRGHHAEWGLHPSWWVVTPCVVVLVLAAAASIGWPSQAAGPPASPPAPLAALEDDDPRRRMLRAWAALTIGATAAGAGATVLGLQHRVLTSWGRPVVLLAIVASVVVLGCAAWLAPVEPGSHARQSWCALALTLLVAPVTLQLLLTAGRSDLRTPPWLLGGAVASAAFAGVLAGWRWRERVLPAAFVLQAVGAGAGWAMSANPWVVGLGAVPLALGIGAAVGGAVALARESSEALMLAATVGFASLVLSITAVCPLTWALGAPIAEARSTVAGGRVVVGLCFALSVLAAACVWLLTPTTPTPTTAPAAAPARQPATPGICDGDAPAP